MDIINLPEEKQNKLLNEIEGHSDLTVDDIKLLKILSKSEFSDVKINIATILVDYKTTDSINILLSMIDDEDELVRTNVIDSLCICQDVNILTLLMEIAEEDTSNLVRRYAILSVVDIAENIEGYDYTTVIDFLKKILEREPDYGIKLMCYRGLYLLDDKSYLTQIEMGLLDADYRNRCATVHILSEIVDEKNFEQVRSDLIKARNDEETYAVINAIESALLEIQ